MLIYSFFNARVTDDVKWHTQVKVKTKNLLGSMSC